MDTLAMQLYAFAVTMLGGMSWGLLFDSYRVLRGILRPGWIVTSVMDLGFWIIASPILVLYILLANWGELRFYVFIGIGLGFFFYKLVLSRAIVAMLQWVVEIVNRLVICVASLIWGIISLPVGLIQDITLGIRFRRTRSSRAQPRRGPNLRWRNRLAFLLRK